MDARHPAWTRTERGLSALLIVFTLAVSLLCVLMLSCTLTQTRMSTIAFSGVNVSIWKLDDIRRQWQAMRDQISAQSIAVTAAEKDKSAAAAASSGFDLEYRPARTKLDAKLGAFLLRLEPADPALAKVMKDQGPVERIETLESQRTRLVAAHPDLTADLDDITTLGDAYKLIDARRIKLRSESDSRSDMAKVASQSLESEQAALDNLFSTQFGVKPIDAATRARIENALFELYSGGLLGEMMHSVLVLSPEILTLVLVVLMGVLGASLQLTHQLFVRGEPDGIGVYALRLCVGAITALVIFIVAKAGVPIVADGSRLGGDTPINPYFVSFLAIISGLMSEQAILSVERQAAKYFAAGGAGETARWARTELAAAIERSKRDRGDLARQIGVSQTVLDGYVEGKQPVPSPTQQLLAGILDVPVRDLFSDLAPDAPAPEEPTHPAPHDAAPTAQAASG